MQGLDSVRLALRASSLAVRGRSIPHAPLPAVSRRLEVPADLAAGRDLASAQDLALGLDLAVRGPVPVALLRRRKLHVRSALLHAAVAEGNSNIRRPKKAR